MNASTSARAVTGSERPGTGSTPHACATLRALILSPRASMTPGAGPIHAIPVFSMARANSGFSERKPYPGWMASAPDSTAIWRSLSALR